MTHHGCHQEADYFDDLPIAKWLNNRPPSRESKAFSADALFNTPSKRNIEMEKNEIMSIASDLNHCNLNPYSTSKTVSIVSTATDHTDSNESDPYRLETIEQLSVSLQFWCIRTMRCYFVKWKNHTLHKLNILHIKYRNYQYVRHRKILFQYFKKWQILQCNYKSTILSLAYWAHYVQCNHFKAWQKYTFQTAPKSRIILCNRIKRYLSYWRHRTQRIHCLSNTGALIITKKKSFQLQSAWIKWILVHTYHVQMIEIEQSITAKHRTQSIGCALKMWRAMFERRRKLKQLQFRMICKQFYRWWYLQSSLSIHYRNVCHKNISITLLNTECRSQYHSLDQPSRNAFAYWYTKRIHTVFKQWRHKQVYIQSLRSKSFQCRQAHREHTRKMYYKVWKTLYVMQTRERYVICETTRMIQRIAIRQYVNHWRQYRNTQNIKRQKNLESQILYARNMSVKFYTFWKSETQQSIHRGRADTFYKARITTKHIQIVFGQWLLITIQQKDTKQKIETKYQRNMLNTYWYEWMVQLEYKQLIKRFQNKWNETKHYDLYLKIFIVWKKQCKHQISLLRKKRDIEHHRRHKIFRIWYLTVYKRHKLNQCQVIAKQCSIQSAFIRWKVTMKRHLRNKRNEIYLRDKHKNCQMIQTLLYWKRYTQHKQNIKCHVMRLNAMCTVLIAHKCFKIWHHSYQLSLRFKSAKQHHIHNTLRSNLRYWLQYNRNRQKHQYMLQVANGQRRKTLFINAVSYWNRFKCHRRTIGIQHTLANRFMTRKYVAYWRHETMRNLSLKSRVDNVTTHMNVKHKSVALEWWIMCHLKERKLFGIETKIETQRQIQTVSTLFYGWWDKTEETKTLRALNAHAIGLHKDKVLTRVFVEWVHLLPVLKREKMQMMKPRLVFNFYQWRKWSADNNNLRDRCYEMQLRKAKRYFFIYREYARDNNQQRNEAYDILNTVQKGYMQRIGWDKWREAVHTSAHNQQKYTIVKQKQDVRKQSAIMNEWTLLYQVLIFAKTKQLNRYFKTWRQEYAYGQIEARITHRVYYHGIKKRALDEWSKLLRIQLDQQKGFESMIQNTNTKHKRYFFQIWGTCYKLRRLCIQLNRTNVRIKIVFWRNYASNRIKTRKDLRQLKNTLTDQWRFYPSSIYQCNYSDDENEDTNKDDMITLSPLKAISIHLAPILAKRWELGTLKPSYKRPTTPTLLCIGKKHPNNHPYNESKDDMFMCNGDTRFEISSYNKLMNTSDGWMKATKRQIMQQVVLKWKYLDEFKVFKEWKGAIQIKKEETRLMKYAEYEFRQKSLEYVLCVWKYRVNVNKGYQILNDGTNMKQLRDSFVIWCSVYQCTVISKTHDTNATLHYEKCNKIKCISYWNGIIRDRKKCEMAAAAISSNKPIHGMRGAWHWWHRLFLFIHQIRNDNNNADMYYYRLLIRHCFHKWHQSFTTHSIIHSLIQNTFIQHDMNTKRRILTLWSRSIRQQKTLKAKMHHLVMCTQWKTKQRAFEQWRIWYQALETNRNIASEIYTQNVFKHYFTNWKVEWFERVRDLKLNESVIFYQTLRAENERYDTLLFWKYRTHSQKELAVKELTFYHSHLVPNLFSGWKGYTQNKRMSGKYYYYNTLRKYMKHWKRFNKQRQRIYNTIDKNFKHMKMQRIKHHLDGWKRFALKCAQIRANAMILITQRGGVALFSSNHLSSVSFQMRAVIHNEPRLLQCEAFDRWRFFYDRNQKLKYFFRLIRLERFVSEWKDHMRLQNRNKYLMSKVPIIVKKTTMKKHFNLWIKTVKQHRKLRTIYCIVSKRQQFRLMKSTFVSFRDYIQNEKRKHFILRRLILCKYVSFWLNRAMKQKECTLKENALTAKYNYQLQTQGFNQWRDVLKHNLASFHIHEFALGYGRSYYVQMWRNINLKHKIQLFRNDQLRQKMRRCVVQWKGFIATQDKISQMEEIAIRYYCVNLFRSVWDMWQQQLFTKYVLMQSRYILTTFHVQFVLQKWRMDTESTHICRRAQRALDEYQKSKQLVESFADWRRYCIAVRHCKLSLLRSAFGPWMSMHTEIKYEKYQRNTMRQIWFVWHHYTQNSMQYDQERIHHIERTQLLKIFQFWIQTMQLKQYLAGVYMDAAKYHIHNLMRKGMTAFKEHRNEKQLARRQYKEAMNLNERILMHRALNLMLYQWGCVQKAKTFNIKYIQLHRKQNCFDIWCDAFIEMQKEEKRLRIGCLHWRRNQLRIVIHKWQLISRRDKQYRKYLRHADNKYNRRLLHLGFVFWYSSFKDISNKKRKLYEVQLSWNKRKRNNVFIAWHNTFKANCHYQSRKKLHCILLWKLLYQYRMAAQHERDKNMSLCVDVFHKWNEFAFRIQEQQIKLDELLEVFIDWRTEKVLKEWRHIYHKHCKATQLYAENLQRRVFKVYVGRIAWIQCEKKKEIETTDHYYKRNTTKRYFYFWIKRYECNIKMNEYLSGKCNKYLMLKREKTMRLQFKHWISMFHHQVNERRSIEVSRRYHNHYIASKVFVEWKLNVKTRKYKARLMSKSLTGLQLMRSKSLSHKISLSHSYIRLSNNQESYASIFKTNQENDALDDNDYDSVLLQTSNFSD